MKHECLSCFCMWASTVFVSISFSCHFFGETASLPFLVLLVEAADSTLCASTIMDTLTELRIGDVTLAKLIYGPGEGSLFFNVTSGTCVRWSHLRPLIHSKKNTYSSKGLGVNTQRVERWKDWR